MSCAMPKDSHELRLAIHERTMRKLEHEPARPQDADPICLCDGEYHWTFLGYGPQVQEGRWLTEFISEKCPNFAKQQQDEFIGRHGDMERTFANFTVADENRDAYTKVRGWRKTAFKTIIIHGHTGRGKTHLAKAVQGEFLKDYERTAFITSAELYELFIKAQPASREYDIEAMQQLAEIRESVLFILDDLGAERQISSGFFSEQLLKLLNEYKGRMIVTTNFTPAELDGRYDAKITSRLMEKAIAVHLRGKDHRRGA